MRARCLATERSHLPGEIAFDIEDIVNYFLVTILKFISKLLDKNAASQRPEMKERCLTTLYFLFTKILTRVFLAELRSC